MTDVRHTYFDNAISREFFDTFCGPYIGGGICREVYAHKHDKSLVVKIAFAKKGFQNIHEWDLWTQLSEGESGWLDWFAPCTYISDGGVILFQKRVKPVPYDLKLPTKIPPILTDLKRTNYGMYKGSLVCCDYGRHDAVFEACNKKGKPWITAKWKDAEGGYFKKAYTGRGS